MEKKYDHIVWEQTCQELWEKEKTYALEHNPGPMYSIDTPPPTVSGSLHIGHIFSYTQTDIIARYKRMSGFSVYYPFGFDDNGLPTEKFIEKKKKITAHSLKRSAFIALCLEETQEIEKEFKTLWQKLGLSANWDYCYTTIGKQARRISQLSFIELYKKGYIYRKNEPALYCTTCRTSVAQAELDDISCSSLFNTISFTIEDNSQVLIATTRPELLPSCVALLYNPHDKRYSHLKNKKAITPLFGHEVPILEDEQVEIDKGTGVVMCCTFGDKTDIAWFKKFNLPYKQSIGLDGTFLASIPFIGGLKVANAREKVLEALKEHNYLITQKPIIHTVGVHERCKKEIEFIVLTQWFLALLPYKKELIEAANNIRWYPAYMKSRYINWVENINWDWCLSRQRFYGVPFPAWHCTNCQEIFLAQETSLPIDPQEISYNQSCTTCGSNNIVPDTDVMDTWNTSSLTPYICLELLQKNTGISDTILPMSMRPQAHDIIRTWAFYTIAKSYMHNNTIPWKEIVISGHVLSNEKEKLSKSKENSALSPEYLLKQYPADAIRYWTASGSLGTDIAFSDSQLRIGQKLIVKLWNAFTFISTYISTEKQDPSLQDLSCLGTLNSWILHEVSRTYESYNTYFQKHEFSLALEKVEKFFWHDFCDNYVELIKDLLFNQDKHDQKIIKATIETLYTVGLRILQLYAPFMPYITETLYSLLYKTSTRSSSLHQTKYAHVQRNYYFEKEVKMTELLITTISIIRKLKTEKQLSLKTELKAITVYTKDNEKITVIKNHESIIKGMSKTHAIIYNRNILEQSILEKQENGWHAHIII